MFRKATLSVFFLALLAISSSVQAYAPQFAAPDDIEPVLPMPKVGQTLTAIYRGFDSQLPSFSSALSVTANGLIAVDAIASGDPLALLTDLKSLGLKQAANAGIVVSGLLPITSIADLTELESLRAIRPAYAITASALAGGQGAVVSQGDELIGADLAREEFGVDGSGVNIGVISDSFDCQDGYEADKAKDNKDNRELPDDVTFLGLSESPFRCSAFLTSDTDEGRAMMQVIHDIAPGAGLTFHSGLPGLASMVNAINTLSTTEGVDVIVSDFVHLREPMFQDGLIAQAVNTAVADFSVAYIASAGNGGLNAYEASFRPGDFFKGGEIPGDATFNPGVVLPIFNGGIAHDFGSGDGEDEEDFFQQITVPMGTGVLISMQWDSPFLSATGDVGTPNDVDIFILNNQFDPETGWPTKVVGGSSDQNVAMGDAVEVVDFFNPRDSGETVFNIMIVHARDFGVPLDEQTMVGPTPGRIKYVTFLGPMTIDEHNAETGSVFGQAAAEGALAVGAVDYRERDVPEGFSSSGPVRILFDLDGVRLSATSTRLKPDLMGPDGVNIPDSTLVGTPDPEQDGDFENDGIPNYFGTSASAAHVAGVAALIMQAAPGISPDALYHAMRSSAEDLLAPGFDDDSGYGLVQAHAAISSLGPLPSLADLAVTKHASVDEGDVGDLVSFVITVTNNGPATSTNIVVLDDLPEELTFQDISLDDLNCTHDAGTVACNLMSLSPGQSASSTITAILGQPGEVSNTATVFGGGEQLDPDDSNNSATALLQINPASSPDLTIVKSDLQDPVTIGNQLTYLIAVTNLGSVAASNVTLTDNISEQAIFLFATTTQGLCSEVNRLVTCDLGTLAVGQTATITIAVVPSAVGILTNTADVTSDAPDLDESDNTDSEDTTVNDVPAPQPQNDDSPRRRRTPEPTPQPTATPTPVAIQEVEPTPEPPTPDPTATPAPVTPQTIEDSPIEEAAEIIQQLPPEEAAALLEEVAIDRTIAVLLAVDRDKAGDILDEISMETLVELIERADQETLIALLVEMSPEQFFLIPLDVLLANLPDVSVEQLARELAPQPDPRLSAPVSRRISDTIVEYLVPRTIADAWAKIIGSPAPLDQVLAKFTRDLTQVRVVVEDFTALPPSVPPLPPDEVLNSIFTIELPDTGSEDISVAHVTLYVEKAWIEENGIHPWSIRLNRLDEDQGRWVPYPAKRVREDNQRVFYSVGIPGFSMFAVTGRRELGNLRFQVSNLTIEPSSPTADQAINVRADVRNVGGEPAIFPATLWVNGTIEDSDAIFIPAGQTADLTFVIARSAGTYEVRVDRLLLQLEVSPEPEATVTPRPSPTPTPTFTPVPTSTATPVPTSTPPPVVVVRPEPSPTPLLPTGTPLTEFAAAPTPPEGNSRGPLFVALAVVAGVLATATVVIFAGNGLRGSSPGGGDVA